MPLPQHEMKLTLKDDERGRIGKRIQQQIDESRRAMTGMIDKAAGYERLYESDLKPKTFPWKGCSNMNVPLIQPDVDTFHAHINDVIFGVKPITKLSPPAYVSDPDAKETAQRVESAVYHVQDDMMDLRSIGDQFNLTSLMTPAGVVKLPWREEYRTVRRVTQEVDQMTGEPTQSLQDVQEIKYRGPRPELIEPDNFVIYPLTAKSAEDAVLIGDRFRLTPDELNRRIASGYFEKDWCEPVLARKGTQQSRVDNTVEQESLDRDGLDYVDSDEYTFWEVITGYDANGDGLVEDCVFVIEAETGTVVRATVFPYWHGRRYYIPMRPFLKPSKRFFARCLPQILEHSQLEANSVHNQRVDATTMAMIKAFKGRNGGLDDPDSIEIAPGSVIPMDDVNDLVELQINPIVPGADIEQINRIGSERASGVNDIATGRQSEGDKTLGELQMVSARAGVRFSDVIRRCQEAYVEIAKQTAGLMYQFMEDQELAQLGVQREWLVLPWQFIPHGNTGTADKQQEVEKSVMLYDKLMENPLVIQNPLRVHRLAKDLLMAMDRTDTEAYIGTEEELQQQMMEQQMMSQAMDVISGAAPMPQFNDPQQAAMFDQMLQKAAAQMQMMQDQVNAPIAAQQGQEQNKMAFQAQENQANRDQQLTIEQMRMKRGNASRR